MNDIICEYGRRQKTPGTFSATCLFSVNLKTRAIVLRTSTLIKRYLTTQVLGHSNKPKKVISARFPFQWIIQATTIFSPHGVLPPSCTLQCLSVQDAEFILPPLPPLTPRLRKTPLQFRRYNHHRHQRIPLRKMKMLPVFWLI